MTNSLTLRRPYIKQLTATEDVITDEDTKPPTVCGAGNTLSAGLGIILKILGHK